MGKTMPKSRLNSIVPKTSFIFFFHNDLLLLLFFSLEECSTLCMTSAFLWDEVSFYCNCRPLDKHLILFESFMLGCVRRCWCCVGETASHSSISEDGNCILILNCFFFFVFLVSCPRESSRFNWITNILTALFFLECI